MTILVYGFAIFIAPMSEALGWSRSSMSIAPSFMSLAILLFGAVSGRIVDRIGARRLILPSILLFSISLASFALLGGPVGWLYLGFFVASTMGIGTTAIAYTRIVSTWFNHARGLALGVATTGAGLSALVLPPLLSRVIAHWGWQMGWIALGLFALAAVIPALLVMRERPLGNGGREAGTTGNAQHGLTMAQVIRDRRFWMLAASSLLVSTIGGGTVIHLLPMLVDAGLGPATAADRLAFLGVGIIIGRLASGLLLDRLHGPLLAFILIGGTSIGFGLLYVGANAYVLAILLIGMTIGSEGDMLAFFTSRYFGMRSYAEVYGWLYVLFSAGSAVGPLLIATIHRDGGNYAAVQITYAFLALVAAALMLFLGHYRYSAEDEAAEMDAPSVAAGIASPVGAAG